MLEVFASFFFFIIKRLSSKLLAWRKVLNWSTNLSSKMWGPPIPLNMLTVKKCQCRVCTDGVARCTYTIFLVVTFNSNVTVAKTSTEVNLEQPSWALSQLCIHSYDAHCSLHVGHVHCRQLQPFHSTAKVGMKPVSLGNWGGSWVSRAKTRETSQWLALMPRAAS